LTLKVTSGDVESGSIELAVFKNPYMDHEIVFLAQDSSLSLRLEIQTPKS